MMTRTLSLLIFSMISLVSISAPSGGIDQIKEILVKDQLIKKSDEKILNSLKREVQKEKSIKASNKPVTEQEFWQLVTHLWLVKRESRLKWDFDKVDYGVNVVFKKLLSNLNVSGVKYKILYLNSDLIPHMGISTGSEYILLISKPFVQRLDLSKQEIALILFDEYVRLKMNTLLNKINKRFNTLTKKDLAQPEKAFEVYLKVLDDEIFKNGFSFQEQFNLTKETISYLRNDVKVAQMYQRLNDKIKSLIQTEKQYNFYSKLYPSPDLREAWLTKLMPSSGI